MQKHTQYQEHEVVGLTDLGIPSIVTTGMLNELLRQQLSPNLPSQQTQSDDDIELPAQTLTSCAVEAVDELLTNPNFEREQVHSKLSELFHQQKNIYLNTPIEDELRKRQFITHCGLVMSPDNCITTQLDDIRVRAFVRGVHAALQQKITTEKSNIHVVYPACGPFAPLLMPLIGFYKHHQVFSATQLKITLIDMQPGAVQSLCALIEEMDISEYIQDVLCMDATQYDNGKNTIDLVILEAMQHGFSREGQLSIARHFSKQLHVNGSFIPQKIIVSAHLTNLQQEFVEQWRDVECVSESDMNVDITQTRIELGDILTVTAESLRNMKEISLDESTKLIECGTVQIPFLSENDESSVILTTKVQTWGNEWIGEYDSGITHPLADQNICINFTPKEERPGDLLLKSGDGLKFYYRLNGLPGFLPTWIAGDI